MLSLAVWQDTSHTYKNPRCVILESLLQEQTSLWALILTELVPEVFEFCPADWPERKTRLSDKEILYEGGTEFALLYESPESLTRDGEFRIKF